MPDEEMLKALKAAEKSITEHRPDLPDLATEAAEETAAKIDELKDKLDRLEKLSSRIEDAMSGIATKEELEKAIKEDEHKELAPGAKSEAILVALSTKYSGSWDKIYKAVQEKEEVTPEELDEAMKQFKVAEERGDKIITILSPDYPKKLTARGLKPPFVLYCRGRFELLKKYIVGVIGSQDLGEDGEHNMDKIVKITSDLAGIGATIATFGTNGVCDTVLRTCTLLKYNNIIEFAMHNPNIAYPIENKAIHEYVAKNGLVVSEVPFTDEVEVTVKERIERRNMLFANIVSDLVVPLVKEGTGTQEIMAYVLAKSDDTIVYVLPRDILFEETGGEEKFTNNIILCLAEHTISPYLGIHTIKKIERDMENAEKEAAKADESPAYSKSDIGWGMLYEY